MDNEIPIRWNKSSSQCLVNRAVVLPSFTPWIWCWKSCIIAWSDCDHLRCYRSSCHSRWGESIPPYHQSRWRATAHYSASPFASMVTCSSSSCSLQKMYNATLFLEYSLKSSYWLICFMPLVSLLYSNGLGSYKHQKTSLPHFTSLTKMQ